mmetsp:Transcript_114/g.348  ORF Transcript_114/g.348 Transcript_114/m.348 type:complete len:200 (-) Transcript_114:255-854(-)
MRPRSRAQSVSTSTTPSSRRTPLESEFACRRSRGRRPCSRQRTGAPSAPRLVAEAPSFPQRFVFRTSPHRGRPARTLPRVPSLKTPRRGHLVSRFGWGPLLWPFEGVGPVQALVSSAKMSSPAKMSSSPEMASRRKPTVRHPHSSHQSSPPWSTCGTRTPRPPPPRHSPRGVSQRSRWTATRTRPSSVGGDPGVVRDLD